MSDHGLLQQMKARRMDGEQLQVLGKHAAARWSEGRYSTLNEAVVQTVKTASLSAEQIKRVVEFANTDAYLTEFSKAGEAGHKVVDFGGQEPASPGYVLQELNKSAGVAHFSRGSSDYSQPPPAKEKKASRFHERELEDMFGKEASALPDENPLGDAIALRDKLASSYESLTAHISGLETMYDDLRTRNFYNVKQAALSGHSLGEVAQIWENFAPTGEYVKVAFRQVLPELMENGVFRSQVDMVESIEKTASVGNPNPEHPLIKDFQDYCEVLTKVASLRTERDYVKDNLDVLTSFVKRAASEGLLMKGVNAAKKGVEYAGKGGRAVGEVLMGKGKGQGFGTAAQVGAVAAPAVLAHEAYRRNLKYDPTFQKAKYQTLAAIPGTQEHNYLEQMLQSGGG